jgi:hypothetical protein
VAGAMRRSGHHAVLGQICRELGEITHLNNCIFDRWTRRPRPKHRRFVVYTGGGAVDAGQNRLVNYLWKRMVAPRTRPRVYSFEDVDIRSLPIRQLAARARCAARLCDARPVQLDCQLPIPSPGRPARSLATRRSMEAPGQGVPRRHAAHGPAWYRCQFLQVGDEL